jgi:formylglycine-generating enzyme required for sulfatase activity
MKNFKLLIAALFVGLGAFANNISISSLVYNSGAGTVTFNISWENSWRVSTAPNNWDAAWVFVKRRNCADQFWKQQYLSATGNSTASPLELKTVPDSIGVFIQRAANGSGTIASTSVTLKLGNLPAPLNEWDFKVFAIEMTYVPQSSFYIGSGGSSYYEFRNGTSGTPGSPYLVSSEAAITFANTAGNLWDNAGATSAYAPTGNTIDANFPKGFRSFYAMKYEISQGQYTDFMNSLPQDMAQNRQILVGGSTRNGVAGTWPNYTCSTPNRAMNYLGWGNLCAYLDWSGLAPMSELEYEKLCRGVSIPVVDEYAWGSNTITRGATLVNDGTSQEGVSDAVATGTGLANFNGSAALPQGPFRVGFAAKAGTTRLEAGAGYYGNMELTGNVYEFCTSIYGAATTGFKWDAHGDGQLAFGTGFSNVTGWVNQNILVEGAGTAASLKGGGWPVRTAVNGELQTLRVSDRLNSGNAAGSNQSSVGGRGVRRVFN